MLRVKDILKEIEQYAPLPLQESFDNAGVQVGDVNQPATGALLCLDVTEEVVDEAIEMGCNLIVSHHPLAFKAFKSLTGSTYIERCMMKACKYDLVIYAAHTNLDNAAGGVNFRLAELIGLENVRVLSPQKGALLKLVTFVPEAYADTDFRLHMQLAYFATERVRPFAGTESPAPRQAEAIGIIAAYRSGSRIEPGRFGGSRRVARRRE